jgi:hypothetical protein
VGCGETGGARDLIKGAVTFSLFGRRQDPVLEASLIGGDRAFHHYSASLHDILQALIIFAGTI